MTVTARDRGRESFARNAWGAAFAQLWAADHDGTLEATDLERLAVAAFLIGRDADSADLWARAHNEHARCSHPERAARCAFWLAFELQDRGEHARAAGWLARARRLLDDGERDCVERGYLLLPEAIQQATKGDATAAYTTFAEAAAIGDRFGDRDLATLARHGQGRTLIRLGEFARGVTLLDEVMVAVAGAEVFPLVVGTVYCSVISACHEMFDFRRAQEWTEALSRWCASEPDLVPYRGQCLARRAEILQLHGEWRDAMDEAKRAGERLLDPPGQQGAGAAFYQQAELHRLRGEFAEAEEAYRRASRLGRKPEPGLALLRLAQGQTEAARVAIRRVLDETQDRRARARMLAACVEIMLAADDGGAARAAADELAGVAAEFDIPFLHALAEQAAGTVLLAEQKPRAALPALRRAWAAWTEIGAPYEAARVRIALGLACQALGDGDAAGLERDAARDVFQQLGATPDLARLRAPPAVPPPGAGELTAREAQVLRLVATGKTNRRIAQDLSISEKTVARHVSNIFTKLGLSSRAAATAYAYEHGLLEPHT